MQNFSDYDQPANYGEFIYYEAQTGLIKTKSWKSNFYIYVISSAYTLDVQEICDRSKFDGSQLSLSKEDLAWLNKHDRPADYKRSR